MQDKKESEIELSDHFPSHPTLFLFGPVLQT